MAADWPPPGRVKDATAEEARRPFVALMVYADLRLGAPPIAKARRISEAGASRGS